MLFSSADATTARDNVAATETRLFSEEINVLYDSKCNVCKLEMDWLVSRDIRLNGPEGRRLRLTDLEDDFDATDPRNGGIDYATGMAAIYAIKHDGTIYKGVPVFELAYDQVGLGWIWKINQIPAVNKFLEWGYEIFAKNRTRITRGAPLEELLALNAAKKQAQEEEDCEACQNAQARAAS
jgi:predicted DCC family thiol-disulfide oxidoreductase YuxK